MKRPFLACVALVFASVASAFGQTGAPGTRPERPGVEAGTDMVEVEPITCWWRTSTSAVQTGQSFGLTLTCSVVETEANPVTPPPITATSTDTRPVF